MESLFGIVNDVLNENIVMMADLFVPPIITLKLPFSKVNVDNYQHVDRSINRLK